MEWIHVRNNLHGNCPDLGSLVKLFIIRDYTPLDIQTMQYLDAMGKLIIFVYENNNILILQQTMKNGLN